MEDEETRTNELETEEVERPDSMRRIGGAATNAIGGLAAAGGSAVNWIGSRLGPQPGEEQETFEEYTWDVPPTMTPEDRDDVVGTSGIEDNENIPDPFENDNIPEIDGGVAGEGELTQEDMLALEGDPNDPDMPDVDGEDLDDEGELTAEDEKAVVGDEADLEFITGERRKPTVKPRIIYNYGPKRRNTRWAPGYYQPPTIGEVEQ